MHYRVVHGNRCSYSIEHGAMAPCFVIRSHDMTIHASRRIIGQVRVDFIIYPV